MQKSKWIIFFICFLISSVTFAGTFPVITQDESEGVVIIQGNDNDSLNLYNHMLVNPTRSHSTRLDKKIISTGGQFELACQKPETTSIASCTLKVKKGIVQTYISHAEKVIFIEFWGEEGNELFKLFKKSGASNHYTQFTTSDNKLILLGKKDNFGIEYRATP